MRTEVKINEKVNTGGKKTTACLLLAFNVDILRLLTKTRHQTKRFLLLVYRSFAEYAGFDSCSKTVTKHILAL